MDDDDSTFQFKDEQERRIYERISLVGVGPAAFYRDACRLLTSHELIDRKLLSSTLPFEEKLTFLIQHMPKNEVSLRYFFARIGASQAIEWLQPLRDKGFFVL